MCHVKWYRGNTILCKSSIILRSQKMIHWNDLLGQRFDILNLDIHLYIHPQKNNNLNLAMNLVVNLLITNMTLC